MHLLAVSNIFKKLKNFPHSESFSSLCPEYVMGRFSTHISVSQTWKLSRKHLINYLSFAVSENAFILFFNLSSISCYALSMP